MLDVMKEMKDIPKKGYVLAYFRSGIIFTPYEKGLEYVDWLGYENSLLLELHCFDEEKESRLVYSSARGRYIVSEISDEKYTDKHSGIKAENISEHCYEEKIYLAGRDYDNPTMADKNRIAVISYFDYDENDMIVFDNYRLKMIKEG